MYRIIFGIKLLFLLLVTLVFTTPVQAQLYLSENSYDGAIPQGPASKVRAVQFLKRGENGRFVTPDVHTTVQLSISNAQIEADGISEVLSFGSNSRETLKWPSSEFVFKEMKSLGSPLSSYFSAGAQPKEGIVTSSNFGYWLFASVKHLSKSSFPKVGESQYLADLTVSFNRSVANPVLHVVGLGGIVTVEGIIRGFSVELELTHPSAYLEMVSGSKEFGVNPDRIYNTADRFDGSCGAGAACGSVRVIGTNLTELTFKVHLRRDIREDGYRGRWPLMRNMQGGDGFMVGVSFDDNGTVSGQVNTITDAGGNSANKLSDKLLRVNLLDPLANKVIASKPVENDGSFVFDGLITRNQYAIQLNTIKGMVGDPPPQIVLPNGWNRIDANRTLLPQEQAQAPHLFVLESAAQSGFDFYLTNLTEQQLAQSPETGTEEIVEKTPTEIYIEEREKLASIRENQPEDPLPVQEDEVVVELENEIIEDDPVIANTTIESESIEEIESKSVEEKPETVMVEAAEPEEVQVKAEVKEAEKTYAATKEKNKVSIDAAPRQEVIIVGSGKDQRGIMALASQLKSMGREVYKGNGPNGMVRVGYYVTEANLEEELEWARINVASGSWILDQPIDLQRSFNDRGDRTKGMGECLIIVGSFAQLQNVDRMFQRIMEAGLTPYRGDGPGQLTRVGFYVDCIRRFQELATAREAFDAKSWVKPQDIN